MVLTGMILLLALLAVQPVMAAHPLVTDDTGTAGRGGVLVELNSEFGFDREKIEGVRIRERGGETALVATYGISDALDLVLGIPYQWSRSKEDGVVVGEEDGLADLSVEAKWRFLEGSLGSLALKPAISLPTGEEEKGLGNGRVSYGLTLIASREFEPVDLHLNLGYAINEFRLKADREDNRREIWHASLAAVRKLTDRIDLVGNIGVERNGAHGDNRHPAFVLGGLIYSVNETLALNFGVKAGLNRAETDLTVLAGLAWSR
ncbi:MAG: transporter [Desulfuromonadales bacterium]|nr:transporter [Desulfuromonadales bacterium]